MRKQSIGSFVLACSLAGCGEPVIVTVGIYGGNQGLVDGGPSVDGDDPGPDGNLDGDAERSDAQVARSDAGSNPEVHYDAGPLESGECFLLYDQSVEAGRTIDAGLIAGSTVQASGCQIFDMADKVASSIYSRKDGKPLLLDGESYSFRWPNTLGLLTKVRLFGGGDKCSVEKLLDVPPPMFNPYVAAPGCAAFTAKLDVSYLRFTQEYAWNLNAGVPLELCKAPCPAAMP